MFFLLRSLLESRSKHGGISAMRILPYISRIYLQSMCWNQIADRECRSVVISNLSPICGSFVFAFFSSFLFHSFLFFFFLQYISHLNPLSPTLCVVNFHLTKYHLNLLSNSCNTISQTELPKTL